MGVPVPLVIGVAVNNPNVLQVRTTLSFSGPAKTLGTMTFMAGFRVNNKTTYLGTPLGSKAVYNSKTGHRFGGVSQTRVKNLGSIGVWVDLPSVPLPCVHTMFGGTRVDCVARSCRPTRCRSAPMAARRASRWSRRARRRRTRPT